MSDVTENVVKRAEDEFDAQVYFDTLKDKKRKVHDSDLQEIYDNCLTLLNKYVITGQLKGIKKLMFHLETIEREREIVKLGVDSFVYKSDIEDYIEDVKDRAVKVCEIADYEREIPDEIVEVVSKTKEIFDKMFVVYTDYTGETTRKVEAEQRLCDPILFGSFMDRNKGVVVERFYFLGDWEDEYCDLTLDKLVADVKKNQNKDILKSIATPKTFDELKAQIANYTETKDGEFVQTNREPKKGFFKKIKKANKR